MATNYEFTTDFTWPQPPPTSLLSSTTSIFPIPSINPPPITSSKSRRIVARNHSNLFNIQMANETISSLNQLYFSFNNSSNKSFSIPSLSSISSTQPTSPLPTLSLSQQRFQSSIISKVRRYNNGRRSITSNGSSGITDLFNFSMLTSSLSSSSSPNRSTTTTPTTSLSNIADISSSLNGHMQQADAVPLVADLVSLPEHAGAVDLLDSLPSSIAHQYRHPSTCINGYSSTSFAKFSPAATTGTARVFASHTEYIKLLGRMLKAGMISFTTSPLVVNGLFGTKKPDGSIRLIIDGRPANQVFIDPPHVDLPTPDLLSKLSIPTGSKLWVAKSDLSDYYYRFRIPTWMHPYFALPPINANELGMTGGTIYPCLTVLAMGWSHSVYLAQSVHEHLLSSITALQPCDRITSSSDLIINRLRHLVYIDDVVILGTDHTTVANAQSDYLLMVTSRGLPAKPSKIILPTCTGAECLGIEVDGTRLMVGARPDKLHQLCIDTINVIRAGKCSGVKMAALIGRWTWCMLITRAALSVFTSVYRFINCAGNRIYNIWNTVIRELTIAIHIAPLLVTSIDATWLPFVMASDASQVAQGVVKADVPINVIVNASSTSGKQSIMKSVGPIQHSKQLLVDYHIINREWKEVVSSPWRYGAKVTGPTGATTAANSSRDGERIECLEMRAASTAIRHVLSRPMTHNGRLLLLSDSQVVVGALTKGRSSSHLLLRRLRPISALLLGSGLQVYCRWVPSLLNPADPPSRLYQ